MSEVVWCRVCGVASRSSRMEAARRLLLGCPVSGPRMDSLPTPQRPAASLLVPFCTPAFHVAVPPLLAARPLRQMCSASARCVCNWHSSAGKLFYKAFRLEQWWGAAGISTTIIIIIIIIIIIAITISTTAAITTNNLCGNIAGSKPCSAADGGRNTWAHGGSCWSFERYCDSYKLIFLKCNYLGDCYRLLFPLGSKALCDFLSSSMWSFTAWEVTVSVPANSIPH